MTAKIPVNLGSVQKTLFLPLWGRAWETIKAEPMLVDPTAVRILEQVDLDFSQTARKMDDLTQIAWIKRSLISDRVIREFLQKVPDGTVVNIGCGLDTTFERVDNGRLRWYDLDMPDVIKLRSLFMEENKRRSMIASSFLDTWWLEEITVEENVFFLAAGIFYYFEEDTIKEFVLRLVDRFPGSELLFDASSPIGVRVANKKVIENSGLDEKSNLVWGLEKKEDLLAWHERLRILHTYYYYQSHVHGLRNKLMGLLSDYLGIQYMIHLGL
ncbi:MAG: class I SAM-dependent methyltransferase [Anaerolineales bacterium]|nr:class I SAM-dependent methyltransferase [Anaerolineales bacterium]